jgi:hypothetical protein
MEKRHFLEGQFSGDSKWVETLLESSLSLNLDLLVSRKTLAKMINSSRANRNSKTHNNSDLMAIGMIS